jgi:hypothetical protein
MGQGILAEMYGLKADFSFLYNIYSAEMYAGNHEEFKYSGRVHPDILSKNDLAPRSFFDGWDAQGTMALE